MLRGIVLLLFFSFFAHSVLSEENFRFHKIVVVGAKRIEYATILSYLDFKEGDAVNQEKIDTSLKNLYASEIFSDAKINVDQNNIIVTVKENPIIGKVTFEGNKRIKSKDILEQISLKPRSFYNKNKLKSDIEIIKSLYSKEGRYSVTINPKIIELDENKINLVFEITEGNKALVERITVIGNTQFSDSKLRGIMATKEKAWYRFLSSADKFDPDKLEYDKELLRRFYGKMGYPEFHVTDVVSELSPNKDAFYITITIHEGQKYHFGDVKTRIEIDKIKEIEILDGIITKKGDWFNLEDLQTSMENITERLNDSGYAFVKVDNDYQFNEQNQTVDITYVVSNAQRAYIDKINIFGNVRTLDKVIRREFNLKEGDAFNASKLDESERKIKDLNFFEKVSITTSETSEPDKLNVDAEIEEKSTGNLQFAGGYSPSYGALGRVQYRERNLLGTGKEIKIAFEKAQRKVDFDFSFIDPYFLDKELSMEYRLRDVTVDQRRFSSYKSESRGASVTGTYNITKNLYHSIGYNFERNNITDVADDASLFIQEQKGRNTVSEINQGFIYDKRNSSIFPTSGYFFKINQALAGVGGDSRYLRHEAKAGYYHPVIKDQVVFKLIGSAGYIFGSNAKGDKKIRINERFFMGGDDLRGFRTSGVGPRDRVSGDALGGNAFYKATAEINFPLGLPEELDVSGAVFTDIGNLWHVDRKSINIDDSHAIRASAGVGINWVSKIGLINLSWAKPYLKESYDREKFFRLTFTTDF